MFYVDHFRSDLTSDEAAALFKKAVQSVEISISSYCNRRCPYCPNSQADRITHRHFMSDELFMNVLRHLRRIEYSGEISIHRYNEPLADRDFAMKRIRDIRAWLPEARITLFTNGDYLDREFVRELAEAGVFWLGATMHEPAHGASFSALVEAQERFLKKLGFAYEISFDQEDDAREARVETGTAMKFLVWARNFHKRDANGVLRMHDRGQSLPVHSGMVRTNPCFMPFIQLQIEWDGQMLPCCEIQPDLFEKDKYTLGRLTPNSDVFLEWTNAHYATWRRDLFSFEAKKAPCATCSFGFTTSDAPELRSVVDTWRRVLEFDAPSPAPEPAAA